MQPNFKKISVLATGNEIVCGDIHDTNTVFFAKRITSEGGELFQHLHATDRKSEIVLGLRYLLQHSEAVIISGGLGPTSDDLTRFALADVTGLPLEFSEKAWTHILNRFEKFAMKMHDSNRQQALFPKGSILFPNEYGTAWGCYLLWEDKHIFMLPGPPRECVPLFEKHVITVLREQNFFQKRVVYRWQTLGLIEGEISEVVDRIAAPYDVETGYRWNYPYLEIKILTDPKDSISMLLKSLNELLATATVSTNGKSAIEILKNNIQQFNQAIYINDEITEGKFAEEFSSALLQNVTDVHQFRYALKIKSTPHLIQNEKYEGQVTLETFGFNNSTPCYSHQLSIPNRGKEIFEFAKHYIAWQINRFIHSLVG